MLKSMISNIVSKNMSKKLIGSTIKEEDVKDLFREIRISLLDADVNFKVVKTFINNVKEKVVGQTLVKNQNASEYVLKIIKDELISILGSQTREININKKQTRVMFVGLQGSGKTTSVAKVANFYKEKHNKKPLLIAADIYRPAAIEQLETLAKQIKVDFYQEGQIDPTTIVKNALDKYKENDFVILDTAGRLQTDDELMNELIEIKKVYNPTEIILTVDGMAGQDIINVAKEFNDKLKLTGMIISKLDSNARAGAAFSLVSLLNVPIFFTGVGETVDKLDVWHPSRMADRILGLGDIVSLAEKAQEVFDEKKAKGTLQRMLSGKFDLEDLLNQMSQMSKFGSLGGVMSMIPGMNKISESKVEIAEEQMKVWTILLSSMTKKERRNPRLFKKQPNRKIRVIQGSGRKMDELNKLLKQWEVGKDKMQDVSKMLKSGKNPFGMSF